MKVCCPTTPFAVLVLLMAAFVPIAAAGSEWSGWAGSNCFKGIDYRVLKTTNQYTSADIDSYDLQIRNQYLTTVHVSWKIADAASSKLRTTNRGRIQSGGMTSPSYQNVPRGAEIVVVIDEMRFGDKDSGAFAGCDKSQSK